MILSCSYLFHPLLHGTIRSKNNQQNYTWVNDVSSSFSGVSPPQPLLFWLLLSINLFLVQPLPTLLFLLLIHLTYVSLKTQHSYPQQECGGGGGDVEPENNNNSTLPPPSASSSCYSCAPSLMHLSVAPNQRLHPNNNLLRGKNPAHMMMNPPSPARMFNLTSSSTILEASCPLPFNWLLASSSTSL